MKPSVLNPPQSRTHRFLLPAASVHYHGAQKQGTVEKPAIYPNRHVYVLEGSTADGQDGTPGHPYGSLDDVIQDEALRAMCGIIAADFYHIHLKTTSPIVIETPSEEMQAFNGHGIDFHGRLVIENWPGERCGISVEVKRNTVLATLSSVGSDDDDFRAKRHAPASGTYGDCDFAVFRDFGNVLFHGIDVNIVYTHVYSGSATDKYGNNSPYSAIDANANLSGWKDCGGCGLHSCSASIAASVSLQPPNPLDIVYIDPPPEEEEEEGEGGGSGGGGGGGSGGGGGGGTISPGGGGGSSPSYESGEIPAPEEEDEVPGYVECMLSPGGATQMTLAMASASNAMRCAECTASISANVATVFGAVVQCDGFCGCGDRFSRDDRISVSTAVDDQEYVYIFRTVEDGIPSDTYIALSKGAAANAYAYGEAASHTSTLLRQEISATATARATRSALVNTTKPFARTSARAVGYSQCPDSDISPNSVTYQANASSPWTTQLEQTALFSE